MKTKLLIGIMLAGSLLIANAAPKDDVVAAAKKLGTTSYSWKAISDMPGGPGGGSSSGKADASGIAVVSMAMRDGNVEIVKKGDKAVFKGESGWQAADTSNMEPGPEGFMAMMVQNVAVPAVQALELATKASSLSLADGAYSGDLPEDAAKTVALPFRGPPGGEGPSVSGAKASIKFWVTDGVLTKYELKTSAKISFNGDERDLDRTTITEIKDVGTTEVTVPNEAKSKLQ